VTPRNGFWDRLVAGSKGLGAAAGVLAASLAAFALVPGEASSGPRFGELAPGQPVRVLAPSIGLDARVIPLGLTAEAVLQPPEDPAVVGWWDGSAAPGSDAGQTVLTGHTLHTGGGSMDRLAELRPGRHVDVVTRRGRMRYEVEDVRTLSKSEVADRAEALFGQDLGDGRLVLVSCADWAGQGFRSNVIVVARPLGRPLGRAA
jgi:LPXTG-site transpeptidase (sortase) family protein